MALRNEHELHQTWGGHTPILKALCEYMHLVSVVECGSGKFSTPVLVASNAQVISGFEHDPVWAQSLKEGHHIMMPEPLAHGITNATSRRELTPDAVEYLDCLYKWFTKKLIGGPIDLLFVDTFTAARVPALIHFGPLARVIVIHDTENDQPDGYALGQAMAAFRGRYRYSYMPCGHTAEHHPFTWTDIFSQEPLDAALLVAMAHPHARELWGREMPLLTYGRELPKWTS